MIKKTINYFRRQRARQRISLALARGAATSPLRNLDPADPGSWEFSAFSQNGEDGIIDYLTGRILNPNRYFMEIGSADGIENNTAWLAIAKKYSGLMVEGNNEASAFSREMMAELNLGVECLNMFVNKDNINTLVGALLYINPDVMSLDIDGIDYYVAHGLMERGLRPKIFVVEYNSAYGPDINQTIIYQDDFNVVRAHETQLYYGVSISGWKKFFRRYDYEFITVDQNGVNAFFVDKKEFNADFLDSLIKLEFQENYYQLRKYKVTWERQFTMIKAMDFYEIG